MKFAIIPLYCSTFGLAVVKQFCHFRRSPDGSGYSPFRCRYILPFWWFRQAQPPPLQNACGVATIPSALMRKNIIVIWNHFDLCTGRHFAATPAGFHVVFYGTFSDFTKRITERSFYAIHTATFTINHFRQNFHLIQFWPFRSNFYTKFVVIVYSCKTSFAGFAV